MTDLQKLVETWGRGIGLIENGNTCGHCGCYSAPSEDLERFARLAMQYAAEEAAKVAEAEAEMQRDSYSHDGCLAAADAIRKRFKAL
jgi:hypothetical protein